MSFRSLRQDAEDFEGIDGFEGLDDISLARDGYDDPEDYPMHGPYIEPELGRITPTIETRYLTFKVEVEGMVANAKLCPDGYANWSEDEEELLVRCFKAPLTALQTGTLMIARRRQALNRAESAA